MKKPLPIDTDGKSIARCGGSTRQGELLKGGNHTDINGSRSSSGRTRKKDVSRVGARNRDEGRKAADLAAENSTSRTELCLKILSPLPPQAMKWSPKGSVAARHKGH